MFQRIIPFAIFFLFACSLTGQHLQKIPFDINKLRNTSSARAPCLLNDVGDDIVISNQPTNQTNSNFGIGETIYLCFNDSIGIDGIGMNAVFGGDPDATTQPGVGFAVYDCPPTVDGPNLAAFLGDNCLFVDPMDEQAVTVSIDFDEPFGGSTTFRNGLQPGTNISFQDDLNNGEPFQWWFAPITFDALNGVSADWEQNALLEEGPCISLDLDQVFSVVYLNAIEFVNVTYPFSQDRSQTRLNVKGGLPEFDGSTNYTFDIINVSDSNIRGSVTNSDLGHRGFPIVKVPCAGDYRITISDGRSCALDTIMTFDGFDKPTSPVEIIIESPSTVAAGTEFCVDITTERFDSILGGTFFLCWDTLALEYIKVDNVIDGSFLFGESLVNEEPGALIVNFGSTDFNAGQSYPDGSTIFSICYLLKPNATGSTSVQFCDSDPRPGSNSEPDLVSATGGGIQIPFPDDNPDNNGQPITIVNANDINIVVIEQKNACPGENNGSIEFSIVGGIPPFQLNLTPKFMGGRNHLLTFPDENAVDTAINLEPGIYDILVQESSTSPPKFKTDTIEILIADLDVIIREQTPISCNGLGDGVLEAQVAIDGNLVPDIGEYDFKWVNNADDTISTDAIAENLSQGAYTVFVESNNGCADFGRTSLIQPMPITFATDINRPSCSGVSDGSIALNNIVGGNAPYTVLWSDGSTDLNNMGVASDTFGFVITDDLGCELVDTAIVEAETELVIGVQNQDNVSCFGFNDGTIDVSGSQSGIPVNGTYTFAWSSNVTDIDNSVVQSSLVSNLEMDSYSVTLTNSGLPMGCQAVREFMITEPDTLIVQTVNITNVSSCSLTNPDGEIEVTFMGGTISGDYDYEWSDTSGMTVGGNAAQLTGQPSGLLSLTVTDDNGCETMIDTAIGTPPPPDVQFQFDNIALDCATDETDLSVIAMPGRSGVTIDTYMWSHDASITGENAMNVGPDTFMVAVTDSDGCIGVATAIVTSPPAIRTTEIDFKPACFATEDGEISVNVAGGNNGAGQTYDFAWSLNNDVLSTTSDLLDAAPESYDLKVTDATGCEFDTLINLGSLPRIVVDFPTADISGVACFDTPSNQCNGEAVANAGYAGTGDGIFTFTWSATGETVGATNTFNSSSLCAGFQSIRVIDTSGCEMIDSVMIPSPDEILLIVDNPEDVTCFGADDGSVNISATGGNGGFNFAWSDGSTDQARTDLAADEYDIVIFDRDGCTGQGQITIAEPEELVVTIDDIQTNNVICQGDANGRITVLVTGGNDDFRFTWTNNVSAIESAAGLAPGTYLIDVEDSKGCMGQTNYTVVEPTPITAAVEWDPIQCNGFQTGIRVMNVMGGNLGDYTFSVDNSPARPIDETITEFGGDRLISLFDAEGCRVDSIYNIEQPRALEAMFAESLVEVDLGSSIDLDLEINGDLPITDIFWAQDGEQPDTSFLCAFTPCDNPTVNPLNNTVYTAFVTDANDCMTEARIAVNVDKNRNVFIPNVFAPNNAGFDTNDRFAVFTGSGVSKINYAKVFNRWGTMVADLTEKRITGASETTEIWDGFIKGEKANQGVYIYIVEIEFIDNTTLLYRGDIALLR